MAMIVTILMVVVMIVAVMIVLRPSLWSNTAWAVVRAFACSANVERSSCCSAMILSSSHFK